MPTEYISSRLRPRKEHGASRTAFKQRRQVAVQQRYVPPHKRFSGAANKAKEECLQEGMPYWIAEAAAFQIDN